MGWKYIRGYIRNAKESMNDFITLGLLAGAYKGGRTKLDKLLTHSVQLMYSIQPWNGRDVNDWIGYFTLCGKIPLGHVADTNSGEPGDLDKKPTCKACARKDPRFK